MTERELEQGVVDVAHLLGFRAAHFGALLSSKGWRTPARYDGKGFPDLVLVRPGRLVFVELKCGRNTLSAEQADWLEALRAAGQEAYVFTDSDWRAGIIEATLLRGQSYALEATA